MRYQLERKRNGSFISTSAANACKQRRLFRSHAQNDENAGSETISDSSLPCSNMEEKTPQCTSGVMSGRRVVELESHCKSNGMH